MGSWLGESIVGRRWAVLVYWGVIFGLTHWPDLGRIEPPGFLDFPHQDKVIHALMYAGWVGIWWWLLSSAGRRVSGRAMAWLLVGGACYGVFDELTQDLVAREPSVWDLAADTLGLLVAVLSLRWRQRRALSA